MTSTKISAKLTRVGNSYAFLIPKALVDCEILEHGKRYKINLDLPGFLRTVRVGGVPASS